MYVTFICFQKLKTLVKKEPGIKEYLLKVCLILATFYG